MKYFYFILLMIFSLLPKNVFPLEPVPLSAISKNFTVGRISELMEDPSGMITIEEILNSSTVQSHFVKSSADTPNLGFTRSTYWIRFSIRNDSSTNAIRLLEYDFPPTDRIEFYIIENDGAYQKKMGGDSFPFDIREFDFMNPVFSFPIKPGTNTYYLKVKTTSALILSLQVFDSADFVSYTGSKQLWYGFFYGILLLMMFYNFFIFIVIRDNIYLLYTAYIAVGAGFQFALNGLAFQYLWPDSVWLANNAVTLLLGLNLFFAGLFSKTFLKTVEHSRILNFLINVCLFLSLAGFVMAFFSYSAAIRFETILVSVLLFTILVAAIVSYKKGQKEARYFLIAWILFLIGGILKALHSNGIVNDNMITTSSYQIGMAWEVTLLSLGLAERLRIVRDQMVNTLNETFHIQKEQSELLEKEVLIKTAEYLDQNELLNKRKKDVDAEIFIAQNMQKKLIPQKNPGNYIASIYKPVIAVGGDLYDFILFENSKKLGIFICDVAGHGVPAALTTSVIKTLILQAGEKKENPDKFLEYMNEMIVSEFNFGFITMYYCIFDPDSREIISCSAGHLPPFLIHDNRAEKIFTKKTYPIGICSNEELSRQNKYFILNVTVLPPGSRVLFYTDGLGECQSPSHGGYFEDEQLEKILIANSHASCHMIAHNLYEAVSQFKENSQFEDDICIICLEVE